MTNTVVSRIWKAVSKQKAVLAILGMMALMLFFRTNFYTRSNWMNLLKSAAILEIVAFGVSVAVICGGCDLSVANGEDCLGNQFPVCGGCLWAQGVARCP